MCVYACIGEIINFILCGSNWIAHTPACHQSNDLLFIFKTNWIPLKRQLINHFSAACKQDTHTLRQAHIPFTHWTSDADRSIKWMLLNRNEYNNNSVRKQPATNVEHENRHRVCYALVTLLYPLICFAWEYTTHSIPNCIDVHVQCTHRIVVHCSTIDFSGCEIELCKRCSLVILHRICLAMEMTWI